MFSVVVLGVRFHLHHRSCSFLYLICIFRSLNFRILVGPLSIDFARSIISLIFFVDLYGNVSVRILRFDFDFCFKNQSIGKCIFGIFFIIILGFILSLWDWTRIRKWNLIETCSFQYETEILIETCSFQLKTEIGHNKLESGPEHVAFELNLANLHP